MARIESIMLHSDKTLESLYIPLFLHLEEQRDVLLGHDRPRKIPFILAILFEMKLSDGNLQKYRKCIIV